MPIGVFIDCVVVLIGCILGVCVAKILPKAIKVSLPIIFGFCAMAIGIRSIVGSGNMTAVVLSILLGYSIGEVIKLENHITAFFKKLVHIFHLSNNTSADNGVYTTVVMLFCCSGFGWHAVMTEAISGNADILMAKAVLDFFTAIVFAALIGKSICAIPFVQVVVFLSIFGITKLLVPFITPEMFANFSICGGVLTLVTGARVAKITNVPVLNLMPALIIVMPLSLLFA